MRARNIRLVGTQHAEDKSDTTYTEYLIEFQVPPFAVPGAGSKHGVAGGAGSDAAAATVQDYTAARRFREFFAFHEQLRQAYVCLPPFPEKTLLRATDAGFVAKRERGLAAYLNQLCQRVDVVASFRIDRFLGLRDVLQERPSSDPAMDAPLPDLAEKLLAVAVRNQARLVAGQPVTDMALTEAGVVALATADDSLMGRIGAFFSRLVSPDPAGPASQALSSASSAPALGSVQFFLPDAEGRFNRIWTEPLPVEVRSLAWHESSKVLATGMADGTLRLYRSDPGFDRADCGLSVRVDVSGGALRSLCLCPAVVSPGGATHGASEDAADDGPHADATAPAAAAAAAPAPHWGSAADVAVAAVTASGQCSVIELEHGRTVMRHNHPAGMQSVLCDWPGRRLLVATENRQVLIIGLPGAPSQGFVAPESAARPHSSSDPTSQLGHPVYVASVQAPADGGAFRCLEFFPDTQTVFVGTADGSVIPWQLGPPGQERERSEQLRLMLAHQDAVTAMTRSPCGRFLISGDAAGNIVVWDRRTLYARTAFVAHDRAVTQILFEGLTTVVSSSADGTVAKWRIPLLEEQPGVGGTAAAAGRDMSPDEPEVV